MKTLLILSLILVTLTTGTRGGDIVAAPSGAFSINAGDKEGIPTIEFKTPAISPMRLEEEARSWPGLYSMSPDEGWIFRTQKSGSGDNIAILYRIEKTGRVMEVVGFNALLWSCSDKVSKLKWSELYHTGVNELEWSKDSKTISLSLRGSDAGKSEGDGVDIKVIYHLESHTVTPAVK